MRDDIFLKHQKEWEAYNDARMNFIRYVKNEETKPIYLSMTLALACYDMEKYAYDPRETAWKLRNTLINEFCPFKFELEVDFNQLTEKIREIDDNTDYIYALIYDDSQSTLQRKTRVIACLSNEKIAAMLRMAFGYKVVK